MGSYLCSIGILKRRSNGGLGSRIGVTSPLKRHHESGEAAEDKNSAHPVQL